MMSFIGFAGLAAPFTGLFEEPPYLVEASRISAHEFALLVNSNGGNPFLTSY